MKNVLLQKAGKLYKNRKLRKGWQTVVRTLAAGVVFCTTYVLILPAITMEEVPACGFEEHVHSEACYAQPQAELTACGLAADAVVVHQHSELCSDADGNLICPLPEIAVHVHDDSCYTKEAVLSCIVPHVHGEACVKTETTWTCTLEETEGHTHSEDCTGTKSVQICTVEVHEHGEGCFQEQTLVCEIPESEEHIHSESCSGTQTVQVCTAQVHSHEESCFEEQTLVCEIPETEGHTHGEGCFTVTEIPCTEPTAEEHAHEDACWQQTDKLTCEKQELQLHSHIETCYDADSNLICTLPIVVEHIHSEACLVVPEAAEPALTCTLEVHTHTEECYPLEEEETFGLEYHCAYSAHTHIDACYHNDGTLSCTIPEHTHVAACVVENLDLNADVETEEDWLKSVSGMTLTGDMPADLLAVAETQLGYQESTKNVILVGKELKGYTRYGAWHGDPYADWNVLFAAFCLDYAAVEDFPVETDTALWVQKLTEQEVFRTPDAYTPKPGDLIFVDLDQLTNQTTDADPKDSAELVEKAADQVGIVAQLSAATEETPAKIKIIVGDQKNKVGYVSYDLEDPGIVGYGQMPQDSYLFKTHEGEDYKITVTYTAEAAIPKRSELAVREILPDTEEYQSYYNQALETLTNPSFEEEQPEVSFARFFDISFVVDGVAVEPAAPVNIEITYSNVISVKEEEVGQVVHFAKDGIEVLNASTKLTESDKKDGILSEIAELFTAETGQQVDTFQFTQNSFSVTGTVVVNARAAVTATQVEPSQIDNTGSQMYVLYAQIDNKYYALSGLEQSRPVEIAVNGNVITLPAENPNNLLWTFQDNTGSDAHYLYSRVQNVGTGRYLHPYNNGNNNKNITTGNPYDVQLVELQNNSFKIKGASDNHVRFGNEREAAVPSNARDATRFYVAAVGAGAGATFNVWFDGTLGGMMSYYGAANTNIPVTTGEDGTAVVELPETWQSSGKYDYKLRGWYDINTQTYYPVNPDDNVQPTAVIAAHTVFYADWIAATYDVGQENGDAVDSLDTNDFITTHVFDYNALFNVLSQTHTGEIFASNHTETWTIHNDGSTVPYNKGKSLGFAFVDYDAGGDISYANNRDNTNTNQSGITSGILQEVYNNSGQDLLDLLFNPDTEVIGKYYAGTGNYLFQYMDSTTENYDGEHDGYYYLDARLNAASYNQSQQRFYVYNYLERTSDSRKDGGAGQYSDLLPFNAPYIFEANQVDSYTDNIRRPGYEYDAKDGASSYQEYNSADDATTNYFFGLRTDIEFFLPNDTDTQDEYGNYGNISTRGEHMVFDFHGDDDVWVFVDGELLLDIGGLHGIMHGRIDFSTGTISYGADGAENVSSFSMSEGTHHMTVYYMERGSSQSNCAIYFNIAPRYDLEITKEDIVTADKLDGAVFSVFDDEAMTKPSELWNSFEEHNSGARPTNQFAVVDGVASCWGISAGKTYYICETTPPPGYPASDDLIRITLNNRGTATIETTTLHGSNGVATEGLAVIRQNVNDTLKIVALTVTNQIEGDTTEVRVEKTWDKDSVVLPQSITVYLTADGQRIGRSAVLTENNGWSYTWTGLPKYREEGIDQEIEYVVEEVFVPDYITVQGESVKVENYVDWVRVGQMSDSETFLLVHNGNALTYDGSFGWMDLTTAEAATSKSAHWLVSTDHDGFHLKNELGYALTYGGENFYGTNDDSVALNQVFYYLNSRLMVHDHDVYYQFGANGSVVREDGLSFQLYQKETLTGLLTNIVNKPVHEEQQTFVEVSKVWSDGAENHPRDSVVIHLYADGKDTGRQLTLNSTNNWLGSFDDLPYYQDGTTTPIAYTVVEGTEIDHFVPNYSAPTVLEGRPVSLWQNVEQLEAGNAPYRIYANGYSLAVDGNHNVITVANNLEDTSQQWKVVSRDQKLLLQNVGTNRYLRYHNNSLSTTDKDREASAVTLTGGYLTVGGQYLELGRGYATATDNASNVDKDSLRITRWATSTGLSGVGYTVTNVKAVYELPKTGGSGTYLFTFGGLLMLAFGLMYICITGRKRQKGGW